MRRKSTRNSQKVSPEKPVKEVESPPKTRRSKRRKRSPTRSSESEDEVITVTKRIPFEETPDTTTKSHSPSDEETSQEPIWKVTSSEDVPKGEIQKLKICLTRPGPDSPEKSKTRSKSSSQTEDDATSSEDKTSTRRTRSRRGSSIVKNEGTISSQDAAAVAADEEVEEKKGKGKSKGKHKSKIDKSTHLIDSEIKTNNEISENVQVTPQSPSIDKPVDTENDYNKVDANDKQNVYDENTESRPTIDEETNNCVAHVSKIVKSANNDSDDEDDEPLSVIKKISAVEKQSETPKTELDNATVEPTDVKENSSNIVVEQSELELTVSAQAAQEIIEPEENKSTTEIEQINDKSEEHVQIQNDEKIDEKNNENDDKSEQISTEPETVQEQAVTVPEADKSQQLETPSLPEPQKEVQDTPTIEKQEKLSETLINTELNQTGDVEMTDLSDDKYAPPDNSEKTVSAEEKPTVAIEKTARIRLKRDIEQHKTEPDENNHKETEEADVSFTLSKPKRLRWQKTSTKSSTKLDLETIQSVYPNIEFPEEPDLSLPVQKERRKSSSETVKKLQRNVSVDSKSDNEKPPYESQNSVEKTPAETENEEKTNIIAFNRKISIVDDTASKLKPPPSPAKNPLSEVLFITNLVRPFTIKQLKELLERTGKICEDGFWTDRIKSKCYVQYETVEEAEATRNALHGVQWPIGNGKKLIIEYATVEDLEQAKNPPAPPQAPVALEIVASKENQEPVEEKSKNDEKVAVREEVKRKIDGPVREWDIGKKDLHRDRSRSRERNRKHRRSASPIDDFIARKQKKIEETAPQKLMDDLFLKTKATPSIYWQPLSPEEIQLKQQQRLIRMEEHKRRMEENSRPKGRDMGRGAFRRRYD